MSKLRLFFVFLCCLFFALPLLAQDKESLVFDSKALGIKLRGPQGWYASKGTELYSAVGKKADNVVQEDSFKKSIKYVGFCVGFFQHPFGTQIEVNPSIILMNRVLIPAYNINTPLDAANANLRTLRKAGNTFKDMKLEMEPTKIRLAGKEAAYFIYEATSPQGGVESRMKSSVYIFIKGNILYTLTFTDKADNFNNNLDVFDSTLSALEF